MACPSLPTYGILTLAFIPYQVTRKYNNNIRLGGALGAYSPFIWGCSRSVLFGYLALLKTRFAMHYHVLPLVLTRLIATINRLSALYSDIEVYHSENDDPDVSVHPYTYHPVFRPLYVHYLSTVYSVCSPFTVDLDDLAYIAAATWPAFVRPVIDENQQSVARAREARQNDLDDIEPGSEDEADPHTVDTPLSPPSEDARIRLIRLFTPYITAAMEALYTRQTNAGAWAKANAPPPNLLSMPPQQVPSLVKGVTADVDGERVLRGLPRIAKFVLVAAYLASTNPSRTDMRMFGRGADERAKRRRKGGSPKKMSAKASAVKVYKAHCILYH